MDSRLATAEAAASRKIATRLIPYLMLCYFISYLDRVNLGFAALTFRQDLAITAEAFGLGAGIFKKHGLNIEESSIDGAARLHQAMVSDSIDIALGAGTDIARGKEERVFSGDAYVMETGLVADLSIVHAFKGDTEGNLLYRKTARNFNPIMATAGKLTVAEVEHLVQPGDIDPDHIVTPGIYVQRIIHVPHAVKHIEQRTVRKRTLADAPAGTGEEV